MSASSPKASCIHSHLASNKVHFIKYLSCCSALAGRNAKVFSLWLTYIFQTPIQNTPPCPNLLQTNAFCLPIGRAADIKYYQYFVRWIFINAWAILERKSPESQKDLHSYIISRFLIILWDLRTKKKGAAGEEMAFLSEFVTARGKSSPH